MNAEEFTLRLKEILTYYSINAAGFAEKIGIGRSSVSHIVSGRNKPSLDFILHILDNFPDITFEWLVYGKGEIGQKNNIAENRINENNLGIESNIEFSNHSPNLFDSDQKGEKEKIKATFNQGSLFMDDEIDFITVFYRDGSFKKYRSRS